MTAQGFAQRSLRHRFVADADYGEAAGSAAVARAREQSVLSAADRRARGAQRLAAMMSLAAERVPAYAGLGASVGERGLDAFPLLTKRDLGRPDAHLVRGRTPARWNATSGSTNTPTRSALGPLHEHNQVVRWLRHWQAFGVNAPTSVLMMVPRSYRLRLFGGGRLRDLAGGHEICQIHPQDTARALAEIARSGVVVANPHILEAMVPDGWPPGPDLLVTSYEQRPVDCARWHAVRGGDVYGLSEVGDVAWQVTGGPGWEVHEDLVWLEILPAFTDGDLAVGELVCTDLTNDVMPLLRLRTGDVAYGRQVDGKLTTLHRIAGRRIAAKGTVLEGQDLMSWFMPTLLDSGRPFGIGASGTEVAVWLQDASDVDIAQVRRRLAMRLPHIKVSADSAILDGLRSVFQSAEPGRAGIAYG